MSKSLEIEYKTLLTASDFKRLIDFYQLTDKSYVKQTNLYFDTTNGELQRHHFGLRVRYFNQDGEATLKTPQPVGLLETTDPLTKAEIQTILQTNQFPQSATSIAKVLADYDIKLSELHLIAQLTTKRAEFEIPQGKLALDESWYANQHDYELELEVQDSGSSKADFLAYLNQFDLEYRPAKNKIVRAVTAQRLIK